MFLRYNLYTIIWAVLILVLILLPSRHLPEFQAPSLISYDKFAHAFVFSVLVLLMIAGFIKQYTYPQLRNNPVRFSLFISISYALVLEIAQGLSSGRTVELYDGIANVVGCFMGYGLFYIIYEF